MANAIGTNGTHERQERYANAIVKLMRPQLRIRNTFSRDYEGNPVSGAVKVPVRNTDVKIVDYDVKSGVALSQSATTYKNIPVDNHKAINELIDGYESQAVPDNLVAQRLESGAYVIASTLEADAIKALTTGTTDSTMADCTADNVYSNILADIAEIAKLGVDKSRIRVAISYATELLLLTDEKFSNTTSQIGAELAREGVIGRINGVNVLTQDLGQVESKDVEYIVYAVDWCQAIDEWMIEPTINDLKDGAHIGASALQGRMVYTDTVTDSKAVRVKKKVGVTDPEITGLTIAPEEGLQEGNANVNVDAVVATLSAEGGTSPFTYALEADETNGVDNASFKIDGTNVKVNTTPLTQKDYKINVKVTDTKGKTFTNHATISVAAAAE